MKARLLALLRLAERPQPPPGSEPTLHTFRASEKFLYTSAVRWLLKQLGALAGILFSLGMVGAGQDFVAMGGVEEFREALGEVDSVRFGPFELEGDLLGMLELVELGALGLYAVQFVFGALLLKLGWEMRWYLVSDESLRIREGLFRVHERTMTVANIQNMAVRQGPIQKLLGIADLEVQTAGGGQLQGGEEAGAGLHVGRFRGIEDAEALRDRIRLALRKHRGSGLGDPEDEEDDHEGVEVLVPSTAAPPPVPSALEGGDDVRGAVLELLSEARAMRAAAEQALAGG